MVLNLNIPLVGVGRSPVVPLLMVNAPVEEKVESRVAVNAPVTATVPVTANDEPFHVKLALSLKRPEAPAKVTRPDVRELTVAVPPIKVLPFDPTTVNLLVLTVMLPTDT